MAHNWDMSKSSSEDYLPVYIGLAPPKGGGIILGWPKANAKSSSSFCFLRASKRENMKYR